MHLPVLRAIAVLRLYTVANIGVTTLVFAGDFESTEVMRETLVGNVILWSLIAVGAMYVIDSFINDVLPEKFTADFTKRWRVLGFMTLAILLGSSAFLIGASHGPSYIIIRCIVEALAAVASAFLGLREVLDRQNYPSERRRSSPF